MEVEVYCRICGSNKLNKIFYSPGTCHDSDIPLIWKNDGTLNKLIRPCECRGAFAHAHKYCLANWIETTKHEYCDICRYKYDVKYVERSLNDWIFENHRLKSLITAVCIPVFIYYICAVGLLACHDRSPWNVLDVTIVSSSYIWLTLCTIGSIIYFRQLVAEMRCWKLTNLKVVVNANRNPQLDVAAVPSDVLKTSGFKPRERPPESVSSELL